MPSAKKQKQKAKKKAKGGGPSNDPPTGGPAPRSNDDIVGKSWRNKAAVPKKSMLRELEAALRYEAASESRQKIVDSVAALSANDSTAALPDLDKMPVTYESDGMLSNLDGRCLLTYGKISPFSLRPQRCPPGLEYARLHGDEEERVMAERWTGEHPILRMDFDVIKETTRSDLTIFLGECWLQKTDMWNFAGKFRSGSQASDGVRYAWPDGLFSVLQCPFCCNMALPCDPGVTGSKPVRRIMIMTNIAQTVKFNGQLHMPHRALPRLCCEECFVSNLKSADEPASTGRFRLRRLLGSASVSTGAIATVVWMILSARRAGAIEVVATMSLTFPPTTASAR